MVRVCRGGGPVVVFHAVLPEPTWRRPVAWAIRACDRGSHMRTQERLQGLLPDRRKWSCELSTYALTGIEGVFCVRR